MTLIDVNARVNRTVIHGYWLRSSPPHENRGDIIICHKEPFHSPTISQLILSALRAPLFATHSRWENSSVSSDNMIIVTGDQKLWPLITRHSRTLSGTIIAS